MDPSSLYAHSNNNMSFHLLRLNTDIEPVAFPYPWNKVQRGPSATTPSRRSRSRAPSIWSTSSICSDDSLAESESDEDDVETEPESLFSAPSPTTTSTTCSSWMSARSSCADPYNVYDGASLLSAPPSPQDARFPRAGEKPRGPRSRPLPTLPTHRPSSSSSPTSPLASNSPITASHTFTSLSESHQQQPVVVVSAPREHEPKLSSKRLNASSRQRAQKHEEQLSFERSLKIASQEDYIDWDSIEDIMCYSDG